MALGSSMAPRPPKRLLGDAIRGQSGVVAAPQNDALASEHALVDRDVTRKAVALAASLSD
jgi:hypothetical protein